MNKLCAEGVEKAFPARAGAARTVALAGVDLRVDAGEFVSIVGPSGCGKSTLFNIMAGLVRPSSGRVLLDGCEPDSLLGRTGYMPQKDLLMPWRTVLDNVTLGLEIDGVSKKDARDRAREELPRFGLQGFEERWPAQISGGMRQRAALLRTFLTGHDLMLLDEPFGALDALTRQAMQEWLLDVWHAHSKTILFITHDVDEAVYLSDRVYVMSGRPGSMELCVEIEMPRPRPFSVKLTPEFLEYRERLVTPLYEAARRQLEEVVS